MSNEIRKQHAVIKGEFSKQAAGWGARRDNLSWTVGMLALEPGFTVLDVATGSALFASAIVPHVRRVIAADITPAMLAQARQRGIDNMYCILAAAENLPHESDCFDRVVTRYSLHHFHEPQPVLQEIYRVCRPGGAVMMIDIAAPEDPATARRYNHLERLRDPSHTRALSFTTLQQMIAKAGFRIVDADVNPHGEMDAEAWFDLSQTGAAVRQEVRSALESELQGGDETGFHPFYRDGRLKMMHTVCTVMGKK